MNTPANQSSGTNLTRVLFIAGVEEAPMRYRAYLPAEALRRLGISAEVRFYTDPQLEKLAIDADLVVLFRVRATKRILALIDSLHQHNKPVLFDIDDLVFAPELISSIPWLDTLPPVEARIIERNSELFRTTMQSCDGVIASTGPLCDQTEKLGLPCCEFPNGVGEQLLRISKTTVAQPRESHPFRIGYLSGTFTHQADWLLIEDAVLGFLERHADAELWIVGQVRQTPGFAAFGERIKFAPLVPWQHLPALTRQLDVNLAPLSAGTFNECKSAIKWLEAALVQVTTIASAIQPYAGVIEHNRNGMLASSLSEWRNCLEQLHGDAEFRHRLGVQGQTDAISRFGPDRQAERYKEVLEWAATLPNGRVSNEGSVPDEPARPHALEPSDLTLIYSRVYPQLPTAPLTATESLEFRLASSGSVRVRVDLLFATYGGRSAPITLVARDVESGELLARATIDAREVAEESWTAFELELSRPCVSLLLQVTLAETSDTARVGLWADLSGSHEILATDFHGEHGSGEKRQQRKTRPGFPCVKLWVEETLEPTTTLAPAPQHNESSVPTEHFSFLQKTMARVKFARYLWRVKGAGATLRRIRRTAEITIHRLRR
jgi:hypothetical protein